MFGNLEVCITTYHHFGQIQVRMYEEEGTSTSNKKEANLSFFPIIPVDISEHKNRAWQSHQEYKSNVHVIAIALDLSSNQPVNSVFCIWPCTVKYSKKYRTLFLLSRSLKFK